MKQFVWYDLNTKDKAAALEFYPKLLGWRLDDWRPEGAPADTPPYTMMFVGDQAFGGIVELPADSPAPAHFMGHVSVPDVDAAVKKAGERGAQFPAGTMDVPTVGRFAPMIDPEGAGVSLFTPVSDEGMDDMGYSMTPGRVGWNELCCADPKATMQFYTDVVGWKWRKAPMEGMDYYLFGAGEAGGDAGGMMKRDENMPVSAWMLYFTVEDCDATLAGVAELGGSVLVPAFDVPGVGRMAVCAGPDGAVFGVAEWKME